MWKITALIRPPLAQSRLQAQWAQCRYIYLLWQWTIHTYRHADKIEYRKKHVNTYVLYKQRKYGAICMHRLHMPITMHMPFEHEHEYKKHHSTSLVISHPWNRGGYGPTIGWQRSVVTSLSLTGSVLNHNHTITTRCPEARWACHYPGHNTNITPVLSLYI